MPDKVALLPTDTVPGLAAHIGGLSRLREDLAKLDQESSVQSATPLTWHAHHPADVLEYLPGTSPIVKRAVSRLFPGPITLTIELEPDALAAIRSSLGEGADDGKALWVRVPDHPVALEFIKANRPVLAKGIPDGRGGLCSTLADARARLNAAHVPYSDLTGGGDGSGLPSTLVRLPLGGGFKVERVGAMSAETVRQRLTLKLLFVCTGNTCRSPMAERIARHLAERRPAGSIPIDVASAGTTASRSEPTTPEALEALRRRGIEARPGGARPLDAEAIRWADQVYVMTLAHLRQAQALGARDARLLDAQGQDVPDPIGGTQRQYDETARRLAELIDARFREFSA